MNSSVTRQVLYELMREMVHIATPSPWIQTHAIQVPLSDSPSQNIFDIGERIKENIPYRGDVKSVPIRAPDPIQELDRLDMFLSDHLSQQILRSQNMITDLGSEGV